MHKIYDIFLLRYYKKMYCIKIVMPHVNTLFIPPLYPTHVMKSPKRQVRFAKENEVYLLPPRFNKMKR